MKTLRAIAIAAAIIAFFVVMASASSVIGNNF